MYYPDLLNRIKQRDTTLSEKEYTYLYYGQVFQDNYKPYAAGLTTSGLGKKYQKGKFKTVMKESREILNSDPLNLLAMEYMIGAASQWNKEDTVKMYSAMYSGIVAAIMKSGNGRTLEDPLVIARVSDEYSVLRYLGLSSTGQALMSNDQGMVDRQSIAKKQPKVKGQKKYKEIYFNITMPFGSMVKSFELTEEKDSTVSDSAEGIDVMDEAEEAAEAIMDAAEEGENADTPKESDEPELEDE